MRCRWKFTHSGIISDFAWNWFRAGHRVGLPGVAGWVGWVGWVVLVG